MRRAPLLAGLACAAARAARVPVAFRHAAALSGRRRGLAAMAQPNDWLSHRGQRDVPGSGPGDEWVLRLRDDLRGAASFEPFGQPEAAPKILVLYGSLRESSFSRKLALEFARLFEVMGCEVRTFDPSGLPVRDPDLEDHPKVVELRALTLWSEGHCWVSPEMHGAVTGCFKNQIDWIPLNTGSVRPTQGRTVCVAQVNGGSQSFNGVNALRLLARWMRMPCTTNQSSVPMAWKEFDDDGRMKEGPLRDRVSWASSPRRRALPSVATCKKKLTSHPQVVDVAEEHVKFTLLCRGGNANALTDRFSERKEREAEGKLLSQEEKEARKD